MRWQLFPVPASRVPVPVAARNGANLRDQIKLLLLALQFFTRVPVVGALANWVGYTPEMLRASARFFPLIGLAIGCAAALCFWLCTQLWSPWIAALLTLIFTALLTGAFHEDGLADYADGIGGSASPAHALEIMKDSRIGSYGALALCLATALKLAALATMAVALVPAALILAHVIGRVCACAVLARLSYVREDASGKSKPLAESMRAGELMFVLLTLVSTVALICLWQPQAVGHAVAALMLSGICTLGIARQMLRRIGGFTGDALGAVEQVGECAVLLAFASPFFGQLFVS